jgi:hypothetical protein
MRETSLVEKLIKNTPLAILVIGVILFVIAAAGGWPNPPLPVHDWRWQIALGVMGVLTAGFGGLSYWRERTRKTDEDSHETYGIEITSPSNGETVAENFIVEGKYDVKPPDGADVVVLEVSPKSGLYYPKTNKVFFDEKRKTWKTASISIALRQYRSGERRLVAATMRKDNALWEYFYQVGNLIRRQLVDQTIHIPGFAKLTPDIIKCHEIVIKRKL